MSKNKVFIQLACFVFLAMSACVCKDCPDLVPERRTGSEGAEGFCRRDNAGNLIVRVRNQTNFDVFVQTTTKVEFSTGDIQVLNTSPMPGGSMSDTGPFLIPAICFNPDCDFTITVDVNNDVEESGENNNSVGGRCIG